jgi:hypothetical protein
LKNKLEKMKKYLATAILLLTIVISSKAQVELNSSGTGAAYTLSVPGVFSLRNGIQVTFKAHANSSAAATMNVSGTGAVSIMKDGGSSALTASDIKTGQIVTLAYDGAKWQMMNPTAVPASTGTVTSVDFAVPAQFSIAGTPLTTSGTITLGWQSNTQNLVLATPNGLAGQPSFRSLVANDIPALDASKITSGLLPLARGGTNAALTATNGGIVYSNATGMAITAAGTSGQVLQSNGAAAPSWTTPTFLPAGTTGQTLRHNGATWITNDFIYNNGSNIGIGNTYPTNIFNILSVRATQADTSGSSGAFIDMHNTANSLNAFSGFRFRGSYNTVPYIDEAYQAGIFFRRTDASTFGRGDLIFATKTTASYGNVHAVNDAKMVIKYATGNVGIGTNAPSHKLHVEGGRLRVGNGVNLADIYQSGSLTLLETSGQFQIHANGAGPEFTIDDGNANFYVPLLIQDGSQANNRVLTSNASGYATWTDLSAISSGTTAWTRSTPNIYPTTLSDNVGIGLSNPVSKVQIHSTSGAGNFRLTSAGTGLLVSDGFSMSNDGTNEMFMTQHENADWYFSTNGGTTAMTIKPTGNVGIGTTTVNNKLDVEGGAVIGSTFSGTNTAPTNGLLVEGNVGIGTPSPGTYGLYSAVGTSTNKKTLTLSAFGASFVDNAPAVLEIRGGTNTVGAEVGVIDFINTSNGSINYNFARISAHREDANATYGSLRFYTRLGATMTEAMIIDENSNVGIGTSTPIFPLHVETSTQDRAIYVYNTKNTANTTFAVYGGAYGAGAGEKRGGSFEAINGTGTNIGLRAMASGGATNWAAYFVAGDVFAQDNVGIGVTPGFKLHVEDLTTSNVALFTNTTTTGGVGIKADVSLNNATGAATRTGVYGTAWYGTGVNRGGYFYGYGGTTAYGIYATVGGGTTNYAGYFAGDVYIDNNLGIGIPAPAYQLQLSLNSAAKPGTNTWTVASDARLKTNIQEYSEGLKEVLAIHPIWFTYTGEAGMPKETGVGVLAQELQKVAPHMVKDWTYVPSKKEKRAEDGSEIPNGAKAEDVLVPDYTNAKTYLAVDNGAMTYMLINAIKEQQKMIEELKREIDALKNK